MNIAEAYAAGDKMRRRYENALIDLRDRVRTDHIWLYEMIAFQRKVSAEWASTRASNK